MDNEIKGDNYQNIVNKQRKIFLRDLSNGLFRILILWTLKNKDLHGYGLMKEIDTFFQPQIEDGLINKSRSNKIYPILKDMEHDGLIKKYDGTHEQKNITIYKITETGQNVFDHHKTNLQESMKREPWKQFTDYVMS